MHIMSSPQMIHLGSCFSSAETALLNAREPSTPVYIIFSEGFSPIASKAFSKPSYLLLFTDRNCRSSLLPPWISRKPSAYSPLCRLSYIQARRISLHQGLRFPTRPLFQRPAQNLYISCHSAQPFLFNRSAEYP